MNNFLKKRGGKTPYPPPRNMSVCPSKIRNRPVKSSIFSREDIGSIHLTAAIEIPEGVHNLAEWVLSLAVEVTGLDDWQAIQKWAQLPGENLLAYPCEDDFPGEKNLEAILKSALVLSKCNRSRYLASGPLIFTRNRLQRRIKLIKINTKAYYELD